MSRSIERFAALVAERLKVNSASPILILWFALLSILLAPFSDMTSAMSRTNGSHSGHAVTLGRLAHATLRIPGRTPDRPADAHLRYAQASGSAKRGGRDISTPPTGLSEPAKILWPHAQRGDPLAQQRLGECYFRGLGVEKNLQEAKKWLEKAAEQGRPQARKLLQEVKREIRGDSIRKRVGAREKMLSGRSRRKSAAHAKVSSQDWMGMVDRGKKAAQRGDADAQYDLGYLYQTAGRKNQSYKEAAKWYRKAARQGHVKAQLKLGLMYEQGKGAERNYTEALKWYRKAAAKGNPGAHTRLGLMYETGRGVPADSREAARWYEKASQKGDDRGWNRLNGLPREVRSANEKGYGKEVLKQLLERAEKGDAQARCSLGDIYYFGRGRERDYKEAAKWYSQAAEKGHADAAWRLGHMYEDGLGVTKDNEKAMKWYKAAAGKGWASAQTGLGLKCRVGEGVPRDFKEAAKWYEKAAEQGDPVAQTNLGLLYEAGRGVKRDYGEAIKWYSRAAERGLEGVQFRLGRMCEAGKGGKKDLKEALRWYKMAAERGYFSAQDRLREMNEQWKGMERPGIASRKRRSPHREDAIKKRMKELRERGLVPRPPPRRRRERPSVERMRRLAKRFMTIVDGLVVRGAPESVVKAYERRLESVRGQMSDADYRRIAERLRRLKTETGSQETEAVREDRAAKRDGETSGKLSPGKETRQGERPGAKSAEQPSETKRSLKGVAIFKRVVEDTRERIRRLEKSGASEREIQKWREKLKQGEELLRRLEAGFSR